jgi:hypothetical protein
MVMGWFLLVVIDIINVLRAVVKTENHPPVGAYCNGPETFRRAFERMQPEPRQIHVVNGSSGVKRCQNIPQLANMFRVYAARVVQKAVSVPCGGLSVSSRTVMRHVAHVKNILATGDLSRRF